MAKNLTQLSAYLDQYQAAVSDEKMARDGVVFAIEKQRRYRIFIVELIGEQAANHLLGEELNVQA